MFKFYVRARGRRAAHAFGPAARRNVQPDGTEGGARRGSPLRVAASAAGLISEIGASAAGVISEIGVFDDSSYLGRYHAVYHCDHCPEMMELAIRANPGIMECKRGDIYI